MIFVFFNYFLPYKLINSLQSSLNAISFKLLFSVFFLLKKKSLWLIIPIQRSYSLSSKISLSFWLGFFSKRHLKEYVALFPE